MSEIVLDLITDRTQGDVDRWRELHDKGFARMSAAERTEWLGQMKGRYNHEDMNRVERAVELLSERLTEYGYLPAPLVVKTNWTAEDTPYRGDIERYFNNIAILRGTMPFPEDTPDAPKIGDRLDYIVANNIEQILFYVNSFSNNTPDAWYRAGEIFSGEV